MSNSPSILETGFWFIVIIYNTKNKNGHMHL
jgi:hypothetical protein